MLAIRNKLFKFLLEWPQFGGLAWKLRRRSTLQDREDTEAGHQEDTRTCRQVPANTSL